MLTEGDKIFADDIMIFRLIIEIKDFKESIFFFSIKVLVGSFRGRTDINA